MNSEVKERLIDEIEKSLGQKLKGPKDFDFLRSRLFDRTGVLISPTTLMRIWGYIEDDVEPRASTLDTLAFFLGYKSFKDLHQQALDGTVPGSNPVLSRNINVKHDLKIGDEVILTWLPDRICKVRYLGDLKFIVVESYATRLVAGTTFMALSIIQGEPLYLDDVEIDGREPIRYVCGQQTGIRFEIPGNISEI